MKLELTETVWLDESGAFTLVELAECSGLSESDLRELVAFGALEPLDSSAADWRFGGHCVTAARAAQRLRSDFELEPAALALTLTLLERVRELESEVQRVRARLPGALYS